MKATLFYCFFQHILIAIILVSTEFSIAYAALREEKSISLPLPKINAESYILIDYNSGKVLAEQNADSRRNPASLTKMMTSYVIGQAIRAGKLQKNDLVTINSDALGTGNPAFKNSSMMFLTPGIQVSVSQLIRGINLQSGNDACVAIADFIAGSQDNFVTLMNRYASSLGLKNTHFQNVHGLDADGQYTSARDMVLIAQALIRDLPKEYEIYKEKEFTFNGIRQINRNRLLWDNSLNVDGIKTGYTNKAGYNLVASATKGQMRLISVIMGSRSCKGRAIESKKLLTWGLHCFETIMPLKAGKEFSVHPIWFGNSDCVSLGVDRDLYVTIPRGRIKDLKASYVLNTNELRAPLQKNQVVGKINFYLAGETIDQSPLVTLQEISECNFFDKIVDYIKWILYRWFS